MRLVSSRSMARRSAMVAVGALAVGGLATLPVMSAGASGSPKAVAATDAVAPAAKTKKPTPKKTTITTKKCATKKKNGAVTCKTIKKTVKVTEKTTKTTKSSSSTTKTTKTSTGPTTTPTSTFPTEAHQDNPFVGVQLYVNPEWSEKAKKSGAPESIYKQPTALWLDRIAAIEGTPDSVSNGPMGLEDHLNEALKQQAAAGKRLGIQVVIYDLPGRDCSALASNGELKHTELPRYKTEYIDPIAKIISRPEYKSLRIILYIEPDSLPNTVTNVDGAGATEMCKTVAASKVYEDGIVYALNTLQKDNPHVYTYIDAGHHGWLGWPDNLTKSSALFKSVFARTDRKTVDGFVVNLANYSALDEPYLNPLDQQIGGQPLKGDETWIDWNSVVDERTYAAALNSAMGGGFGMVVDTSRNGWGGADRPTAKSTSTDRSKFVAESRIDRRIHAGNWCNQSNAGIGERPTAAPTGLDAYVWVKPPGESDGNSEPVQNNEGKGFDRMCDPTYEGNARNKNNKTGAMSGAPLAGAWFDAQFKMLLKNAWPKVS